MESFKLKRRILLIQLVLLLFIPFFLGIVLNYLVQRMTPYQLKWMFICYSWEALVFSWVLVLPYIWAKPIEDFFLDVRQAKQVKEREILRIQRQTFNYPLKVVLLVVILCVFAYTLGGIQLVYFANLNIVGVINGILIGIIVSIVYGLFCFFSSERTLQPVGELISSMTLKREGIKKVGFSKKVITMCLLIAFLPLLGVSTVILNKTLVAIEWQVKERGLDRLRMIAKLLDDEKNKKRIVELANEAVFSDGGYSFIIDDAGKLIFHSQKEMPLDGTIEEEMFPPELIENIFNRKTGTFTDLVTGRLMAYTPSQDGKSIFVSVFSMSGQYDKMKEIGINILIVTAIVVVLVILLSLNFSRNIVKLVNKIVSVLKDMAIGKGDLTQRISVNSNDELGELSNLFDTFLKKFYEIVERVANVGNQVAISAKESYSTFDEIAKDVKAQSNQTIEISTSIEEMSATVKEVAKNASDAAESSKTAALVAKEGKDVVYQTVQGMQGIAKTVQKLTSGISALGQKADEIGEIIEVVEDIADQTNLLALNAAIEAARAGEHGRGFSVVADEVRKLAERTTAATKEVASAIKAIQDRTKDAIRSMGEGNKEVEIGVELANQSGEALNRIIGDTRRIYDMVAQIATAAEEQSVATEQISIHVESITSIIGKTNSSIVESASSASELANMAESLQVLVDQFRLHNVLEEDGMIVI
ncbi:MAG: methyl-accepting chemotaxis protein [Thermodesulfobacteriota bacterium]|nr:methyl-accepting chemotaxis protein [Thermodesulfobacteriota bacterium]